MSWGERGCVYYGVDPELRDCKPDVGTCNTECNNYESLEAARERARKRVTRTGNPSFEENLLKILEQKEGE